MTYKARPNIVIISNEADEKAYSNDLLAFAKVTRGFAMYMRFNCTEAADSAFVQRHYASSNNKYDIKCTNTTNTTTVFIHEPMVNAKNITHRMTAKLHKLASDSYAKMETKLKNMNFGDYKDVNDKDFDMLKEGAYMNKKVPLVYFYDNVSSYFALFLILIFILNLGKLKSSLLSFKFYQKIP